MRETLAQNLNQEPYFIPNILTDSIPRRSHGLRPSLSCRRTQSLPLGVWPLVDKISQLASESSLVYRFSHRTNFVTSRHGQVIIGGKGADGPLSDAWVMPPSPSLSHTRFHSPASIPVSTGIRLPESVLDSDLHFSWRAICALQCFRWKGPGIVCRVRCRRSGA